MSFWRNKKKEKEPQIDFIKEMQVLRVQPGDVIILKSPVHYSEAAIKHTRESFEKAFPDLIAQGIKVILFEEGLDIGVLRVNELLERLK